MNAIVFILFFIEFICVASPQLTLPNKERPTYLTENHLDSELTSMVEDIYSRLSDAVVSTSGEEFSILLDRCSKEFFEGGFDRSNLFNLSHLKVWWARALESGIDYTLLNDSPQLPLAYQLFYDKGVIDRLDKIRVFAEYGGFSVSHIEHFESISLNDTNLHTAFKYLEQERQKDEELVLLLIKILFSNQNNEIKFHDELDRSKSKSYAINYLKRHHSSLLVHLLISMGPEPALELVDIIFANNIDVVHSFVEAGTQIKIPVGCALLDKVLLLMEQKENLINKEKYNDNFGAPENDRTIEQFSEHYIRGEIFSRQNLYFLKKIRLQKPFLLEEIQWQAFESFIKIGMVRNKILGYLGKSYLSKIILSEKSEQFEDFVKYLRRSSERLRLIEFSRGMDHLFLIKSSENLICKAAKVRSYEILSNLVFLLGDEILKPDQYGNTTLHHVLLDGHEMLQSYETTEKEKKGEKILKLFLFSERLDKNSLIQSLIKKNKLGETCLSIAAKRGLYRCFETIRNFLLTVGAFNQNDHIDLEELNFSLLKGMRARAEVYPIDAIECQKEVLEGMINSYYSLECFDQSNEKHQEFMNLVISELEECLNVTSAVLEVNQRVYRNAFKMVRKNFERGIKSRAFVRAPLAIQMSYYDKPLRIIVKRIIEDFPEGVLTSEKILDFIIDECNVLPPFLKDQITSIIEQECVAAENGSELPSPNSWKNQAKWLAWAHLNPK